MSEGRRRWNVHLFAIAIYILLSLILTLPLAGDFTTHVPGDGGDDPALAWNLWWVKWSLVDQVSNPFDCRHMFYPLGINLAFYTLTVLNGCLSVPLQGVFGLITVSNLIMLSSFVLGAYGAFLLVLDLAGQRSRVATLAHEGSTAAVWAGALFAGLVYGFSSSKLFYASLGQFNIASTQWIPYYALMLIRMGRHPREWRYPLLAGVFLLLQGWAEMTYATFLIVFTAIYFAVALWQAWRAKGREPDGLLPARGADGWNRQILWPIIRGFIVLALVFLVGMSPILAQMLPDMRSEGDFFVVGSGFAEDFSTDLVGFFVPTQLNPWFGHIVDGLTFPHDKAQHYYIGYGVLLLAVLGVAVWRRRGVARFWAVSALTFFVLCLGPSLRVNGQTIDIPLPFRIFQIIPFFKGNRYPSRYGVFLVLCMAVLAGIGLIWAWDRLARKRLWYAPTLGLICILAFLLGHLSIPMPLSDLSTPPAYAAVEPASEDGIHTLLELPPAWRNGFRITGVYDPIFMYAQFYQTEHHQRLLAGNTSRNPELKFQYFTEAPILGRIIGILAANAHGAPVDRSEWTEDREIALDVLRFFDIRQVVLHLPTAGPDLTEYVETVLPVMMVHADETYRVYDVHDIAEVSLPASNSFATPYERLSLGEGWGVPTADGVWATSANARLMTAGPDADSTLLLSLRSPAPQQLTVAINDCSVGEIDIDAEWRDYALDVPAECMTGTLNDIWLHARESIAVSDLEDTSMPLTIGTTGVQSPADITVQSAGWDVGDLGHIYINGVDQSPNGRGYNLVTLDPATGKVRDRLSFDTHLDVDASHDLVTYIENLPAGSIVALAAKDEASMSLDESAVVALRQLGFEGNLRGHFRGSHAGVGVKGAPAGSALEALVDWQLATVVVGNGATRDGVYFQLRSFCME